MTHARKTLTGLTIALLMSGTAITSVLAAEDAATDTMTTEDTAKETMTDTKPMDEKAMDEKVTKETDVKGAAADDADTMTNKEAKAAAEAATIDVPADGVTVSTYYNEDVYDAKENKIGDVNDLVLDSSGKIQAVIVGVGGFLGVGEKDVAVPFEALKVAEKDGDTYLVMDATKQTLEKAPGLVYNEETRQWTPVKKQG
jgi:sporulation protein YlmC with PRC-barrel domain